MELKQLKPKKSGSLQKHPDKPKTMENDLSKVRTI